MLAGAGLAGGARGFGHHRVDGPLHGHGRFLGDVGHVLAGLGEREQLAHALLHPGVVRKRLVLALHLPQRRVQLLHQRPLALALGVAQQVGLGGQLRERSHFLRQRAVHDFIFGLVLLVRYRAIGAQVGAQLALVAPGAQLVLNLLDALGRKVVFNEVLAEGFGLAHAGQPLQIRHAAAVVVGQHRGHRRGGHAPADSAQHAGFHGPFQNLAHRLPRIRAAAIVQGFLHPLRPVLFGAQQVAPQGLLGQLFVAGVNEFVHGFFAHAQQQSAALRRAHVLHPARDVVGRAHRALGRLAQRGAHHAAFPLVVELADAQVELLHDVGGGRFHGGRDFLGRQAHALGFGLGRQRPGQARYFGAYQSVELALAALADDAGQLADGHALHQLAGAEGQAPDDGAEHVGFGFAQAVLFGFVVGAGRGVERRYGQARAAAEDAERGLGGELRRKLRHAVDEGRQRGKRAAAHVQVQGSQAVVGLKLHVLFVFAGLELVAAQPRQPVQAAADTGVFAQVVELAGHVARRTGRARADVAQVVVGRAYHAAVAALDVVARVAAQHTFVDVAAEPVAAAEHGLGNGIFLGSAQHVVHVHQRRTVQLQVGALHLHENRLAVVVERAHVAEALGVNRGVAEHGPALPVAHGLHVAGFLVVLADERVLVGFALLLGQLRFGLAALKLPELGHRRFLVPRPVEVFGHHLLRRLPEILHRAGARLQTHALGVGVGAGIVDGLLRGDVAPHDVVVGVGRALVGRAQGVEAALLEPLVLPGHLVVGLVGVARLVVRAHVLPHHLVHFLPLGQHHLLGGAAGVLVEVGQLVFGFLVVVGVAQVAFGEVERAAHRMSLGRGRGGDLRFGGRGGRSGCRLGSGWVGHC